MCERDRTAEASASTSWGSQLLKRRPGIHSIEGAVQREARLRLLGMRNSMLLDNGKLEHIWYTLRQHNGNANAEDQMNYEDFCQAAASCKEVFGPAVEQFFRPSTFLRLARDTSNRLSLLALFNYIMRRNAMIQTRVHLSCFDEVGEGWLSEQQLRSYITQLVPELPGLQGLENHLDLETYTHLAVRKFVVLLSRRNRLKISHLLPSLPLAELLEMRLPDEAGLRPATNWFGLESAAGIVAQFKALDIDGNGHLSIAEFAGFSGGTMSNCFVARLFEQHAGPRRSRFSPHSECPNAPPPVTGEMGFTAFIDFYIAWENRATPGGLAYFFPVLDLHSRGYITQVEIYTFLKEIYDMWVGSGQYQELCIEDVKDEIFDMVQPADPLKITAKDLASCGVAGTVIGMLADVNLFWEYDMRETLLQADDGADHQGAGLGEPTLP